VPGSVIVNKPKNYIKRNTYEIPPIKGALKTGKDGGIVIKMNKCEQIEPIYKESKSAVRA